MRGKVYIAQRDDAPGIRVNLLIDLRVGHAFDGAWLLGLGVRLRLHNAEAIADALAALPNDIQPENDKGDIRLITGLARDFEFITDQGFNILVVVPSERAATTVQRQLKVGIGWSHVDAEVLEARNEE